MQKNFTRVILLILAMWLPFTVNAGEIRLNNNKPGLIITGSTPQEIRIKTNISSILFRDIETTKGTFTELFSDAYGYSNEPGNPKLPVLRKLIEVPSGSTFSIQIISVKYTDINCSDKGISHPVIPSQYPVSKAITDPAQIPFEYNAAAYQQNAFLGGEIISAEPVGQMRALSLARIDIAPVKYNPVTGILRIFEEVEAVIVFENGNTDATNSLKQKTASPYFERAYRKIANYNPVSDELITSAPVTYVIVSDPMFESTLQPFIEWKTRKGFKIIEAYTNDPAVGTTTTSIKAYLQGLYNAPPAGFEVPSFILFVGDVAQIPAWTNNGQPTDLRYCEYTGDNIPEVYYGRFSATSIAQLQPQIDKTLEYEQYQIPDDTYLGEVSMIAGADASHQLTWGNGQINYGTTYYFNSAHNLLSHTYLQPEPSGGNYSQNIRNDVSNGVAYQNYTAHGSESGWADPSFQISHIPALNNLHKYCLMVGNCCLTSRFNVTSFAEEIVRASGKGALGYIGASNNSYWDEDFWWGCGLKSISANPQYDPQHLGAYDVTFHDNGEAMEDWFVTQGQMFVGGNLAVEESNSSMKMYYWEIYCLMGDPSLSVYFSVPPQLTATYPQVLLIGTSTMNVTTEPYAYIGLSMNDTTFISAACADASGSASFTFSPLSTPGYLDIVITKQNMKPLIDSIQVIPATGPYLTLSTYTVSDSAGGNNNHLADFTESVTLNVTIGNLGILTASDVVATISTADTNIILTDNTQVYDSVPAGGSVTEQDAFALTVKNNVADQHLVSFDMVMTSGTETWNSTLVLPLNAPLLTVSNLTVMDPAPGGNNNGVLDPGENATLRIATVNKGHAVVSNAVGHLSVLQGSGSYIIVNNPDYYIGNLGINAITYVYFNVITNGITPAGTVVQVQYSETAGLQNQYAVSKDFEIEIGQVPQYPMSNGNITTCNGNFYDSGGPENNYPDNENKTMTFYPGTSGAKLKAVFSAFEIEPSSNCNYDYLRIYDGPNTTSTLVGTYCGTNSPGSVNATNSGGSLTFVFHSDYSDNFSGWESQIQCIGGPLTLIANAFPSTVCLGSSSQLTAIPTGGSGNYTYQWTPSTYLDDPTSATPVCTPEANITYTVTVSDGTNNLTSAPIDVTVADPPAAAVITLNGTMLESDVEAGNQWYLNGAMIPGANSQTFTPAISGLYYATVTDTTTGCTSDPSNSIYFVVVGIVSNDGGQPVSIFPNPFRDQFTVSFELTEASPVNITLCDGYGHTLLTIADLSLAPAGSFSVTSATGNIQPGVYFCKIRTGLFNTVKKVVVTR